MRISLKAARINANMSQKQLAEAISVTPKTIMSWEKGKTLPKTDKVEALCNALKTNYNDIQWQV